MPASGFPLASVQILIIGERGERESILFFVGGSCCVCFRSFRLGFLCLVLLRFWRWFFFCFGCASSPFGSFSFCCFVGLGCVGAVFALSAFASGGSRFCPCLGVGRCPLSLVSVVFVRSFRWRFLPCLFFLSARFRVLPCLGAALPGGFALVALVAVSAWLLVLLLFLPLLLLLVGWLVLVASVLSRFALVLLCVGLGWFRFLSLFLLPRLFGAGVLGIRCRSCFAGGFLPPFTVFSSPSNRFFPSTRLNCSSATREQKKVDASHSFHNEVPQNLLFGPCVADGQKNGGQRIIGIIKHLFLGREKPQIFLL